MVSNNTITLLAILLLLLHVASWAFWALTAAEGEERGALETFIPFSGPIMRLIGKGFEYLRFLKVRSRFLSSLLQELCLTTARRTESCHDNPVRLL